jgi:hypothetical protein
MQPGHGSWSPTDGAATRTPDGNLSETPARSGLAPAIAEEPCRGDQLPRVAYGQGVGDAWNADGCRGTATADARCVSDSSSPRSRASSRLTTIRVGALIDLFESELGRGPGREREHIAMTAGTD